MKYIGSIFTLALWLGACGSDGANDEPDPALGTESSLSTGMPCGVQQIVEKYCSSCHGATLAAGAPMSLTTQASFQDKALNASAMYTRVLEKLVDPTLPMPPASRPQLSASEKKTLTDWLSARAPRSTEKCAAPATDTGTLPALIPDSECELIVELRTHGTQDLADTSGYQPPQTDDHYECFYFPVSWTQKMQVLKIEPLIGEARVLHHFLLYQEPKQVAANGSHKACAGVHPSAALLTGWAPGGQPVALPPEVGLQVASGPEAQFNLEVHYNNSARYTDVKDSSGARICLTSKLRRYEASSHWLGSELIINPPGISNVTGTCDPKQTAHIISTTPHMHRTGKHMKTEITFANGSTATLVDRPFDFNDQQIYPVGGAAGEIVVGPGDRLTTTCTYENDSSRIITFGQGTAQEMCYNFVVAWPAGSLNTGGNLLDGPNRCMQ